MNVAFAKIIHFNYIVPYIHQSLVKFCFFKFYNQAVFAAHYHKGKDASAEAVGCFIKQNRSLIQQQRHPQYRPCLHANNLQP